MFAWKKRNNKGGIFTPYINMLKRLYQFNELLKEKKNSKAPFYLFNSLRHDDTCKSVNWVNIGSDNGMLPIWFQIIIWTNEDYFSIGTQKKTLQ